MSNTLMDAAPGFDQPIAMLKHCHDKIRQQLATLKNLLTHLPRHGADAAAQQAAMIFGLNMIPRMEGGRRA